MICHSTEPAVGPADTELQPEWPLFRRATRGQLGLIHWQPSVPSQRTPAATRLHTVARERAAMLKHQPDPRWISPAAVSAWSF